MRGWRKAREIAVCVAWAALAARLAIAGYWGAGAFIVLAVALARWGADHARLDR